MADFGISETMMAVSMAMAAAGTATSVAGQAQQAQAQAAQAQYQAQVARNNQMVQQWNAANALKQGQIAEDQSRQKTSLMIGAQRAALAAEGGDITSGSAVDILGDTGRAGEMDALTIRSNATRQAWGFQVAGANAGAQAGLDEATAANAMASLPYGIGSSLLSGASSQLSKWSPSPASTAGSPISASAAMAAYNAAPSWFTRPGM